MEYIVENNNIVVNKVYDFDIEHILECGQCFRFYKNGEKDYLIVAFDRLLRVTHEGDKVVFHNTSEEDIRGIWVKYFDLDRNYGEIKTTLGKLDQHLHRAVHEKSGIRILQQDTWEMLISFIISQNKHITHIKKLIEELSKKYGSYIGEVNGTDYYSFPTVEQLSRASEDELRELKVGFRAPYIVDACRKVRSGEVDLESLVSLDLVEAKKELVKIKGVGTKVADCVLLFGAGRYDVFPTDVWVKRIMEYYYFNEDTKIQVIHDYAKTSYGDLAGFAQQYLFYYARDLKIGKK